LNGQVARESQKRDREKNRNQHDFDDLIASQAAIRGTRELLISLKWLCAYALLFRAAADFLTVYCATFLKLEAVL
jgi:hypothetical protein